MKIYLAGGFGNNLFQLYLANLLRKKGITVDLFSNLTEKNIITSLLGWTIHENELSKLRIKTKRENFLIFLFDFFKLSFSRLLSSPFMNAYYDSNKTKAFLKEEFLDKLIRNNIISGYFQYSELLSLKELEEFKTTYFAELSSDKKLHTCLHLRGGDLINENIQLLDFYRRSINYLGVKDVNIISNDKNLVKLFTQANKDLRLSVLSSESPLNDFMNMANCENLICSKSTFSLWSGLIGSQNFVILPEDKKINFYENNAPLEIGKKFKIL